MKKMNDLTDLFTEQLKELYSAEKQQLATFPKYLKKVESADLKQLNQKVIDKTELQIKRIEEVLELLEENKKTTECKPMTDLLDRGLALAKNCENKDVQDAALITSIQGVKHFEIALYGTLIAFADLMEKQDVVELLKKSIAEEKALDKELTVLAEKSLNKRANNAAVYSDY